MLNSPWLHQAIFIAVSIIAKTMTFNKVKILALSIVIICVWLFLFLFSKPDGFLHVYFLDIGQGDAIFMRTPSGVNILVDGGPDKKILSELKDILPFFDAKIDYLISTHPDKDHIEGLIYILKKYKVRRVFWNGDYKTNYLTSAFFQAARNKNITPQAAAADEDIALEDGVFIDIIFPFRQNFSAQENTNANSVVANVIFGRNEILLTGDADNELEEKLIKATSRIDADILKVGHHGSKFSTGEDFLSAVTPEYSVIQSGKDNKYGHPDSSVLKKLKEHNSKIFRNDLNGRIEFVFSNKEIVKIITD